MPESRSDPLGAATDLATGVVLVVADVPDADLAQDEELVRDFARTVIERAAPEELVLFDDSAADYFRDPQAVLDPARRDEAVGFGLDLAMLTPYVLAVAGPVLAYLVKTVAGVVKEESTPLIRGWVKRLFRRGEPGPEEPRRTPEAAEPEVPTLTPAQAAEVRELAHARALDLGLPQEQARLLADSVVGGLVTDAP